MTDEQTNAALTAENEKLLERIGNAEHERDEAVRIRGLALSHESEMREKSALIMEWALNAQMKVKIAGAELKRLTGRDA